MDGSIALLPLYVTRQVSSTWSPSYKQLCDVLDVTVGPEPMTPKTAEAAADELKSVHTNVPASDMMVLLMFKL
jgi:hypothetical protein